MAISSPNVVSTGGGGRGNQFAQLMSIAAQGVATAATLKFQREQLEEQQRQHNNQIRQGIAQDPGAFAVLSMNQPHLAGGLLESLGLPPDKIGEAVKQMANVENMTPQQQALHVVQVANANGIQLRDFQTYEQADESRQRGGPAAPGPAASMGQIDPGFAPGLRQGQGITPEDPQTVEARSRLFGQTDAFAPGAETGMGGALQAGVDPQVDDEHLKGGLMQAESGFALPQIMREFVENPRDARVLAEAVQPNMIWTESSREGNPILQRAVQSARLSEFTGRGDHTRFNDISNALNRPDPDYNVLNRILPHPNTVLGDGASAENRDTVKRLGFVDENGHVTAESTRDYAAFRAMVAHKARAGDPGGQLSTITDDEMRSRFFWAFDDRLTATDINVLNNIDVNNDAGVWDEGLTLDARRVKFAEIIAGKAGINQLGEIAARTPGFDLSEVRFRDAFGQGTYQRMSNSVANYIERVTNSDFGMNPGHVRAALAEQKRLRGELHGYFSHQTPDQLNARAEEFAQYATTVINNFPGGLEGVLQHANGGYSLEAEAIALAANALENDAQRALAEAGLTIDAMQSMMLAWQSTLPDSDQLFKNAELGMRYLTDSGYFELSESDRIKRAERDPMIGSSFDAMGFTMSIATGMPLRPADWTNPRFIRRDQSWGGVAPTPIRSTFNQPGTTGDSSRAMDFTNQLLGGGQ